MRRRYEPSEMVALLDQREREQLSYRELSERSGVPVPTLLSWNRRLRERDERAFIEVIPQRAPISSEDRFEVVLRSGHRVVVPTRMDVALLRELVLALEAT